LPPFEELARKLRFRPKSKEAFQNLLKRLDPTIDPELFHQMLLAQGFPLLERQGRIYLKSAITPYQDQEFVVVDIETNGSKPKESQIIEIGAVKFTSKGVIDRFESLVHATAIPEYVVKLTGLTPKLLHHAPSQKEVLWRFRAFLGDAIFIAHNARFDYNFLSAKLEELGYGPLANRYLCSIDLARRTIESERYGLEFLKERLGLQETPSHRAFADAWSTYQVVRLAFDKVPDQVRTTEDLIDFSRDNFKGGGAKAGRRSSLLIDPPRH